MTFITIQITVMVISRIRTNSSDTARNLLLIIVSRAGYSRLHLKFKT